MKIGFLLFLFIFCLQEKAQAVLYESSIKDLSPRNGIFSANNVWGSSSGGRLFTSPSKFQE